MTDRLEGPRPLHGDYTYGLKVSTKTGDRTLAHRMYAHEFGVCERIKSVDESETPGVKKYELYETGYDAQNNPFPLEVAEQRAENPALQVLISRLGNIAVISSKLGYKETGFVVVPPPHDCSAVESSVDQVDLVDYAMLPNHNLIAAHMRRFTERGGDPQDELTQIDADNIFRFMVAGLSEVD